MLLPTCFILHASVFRDALKITFELSLLVPVLRCFSHLALTICGHKTLLCAHKSNVSRLLNIRKGHHCGLL